MGDFYGTGIEIWAGLGPVFHVFIGKKNLKNIVDGENILGIE